MEWRWKMYIYIYIYAEKSCIEKETCIILHGDVASVFRELLSPKQNIRYTRSLSFFLFFKK